MAEKPRTILICSCEDTMPLDARRGAARPAAAPRCRPRASSAAPSSSASAPPLAGGEPLTVACTQEAPLFSEVAGEAGARPRSPSPISARPPAGRPRPRKAGPKMAALLAAAAEPVPRHSARQPARARAWSWSTAATSSAIEAGKLLDGPSRRHRADHAAGDIAPPRVTEFPVVQGHDPLRQGPSRRLRARPSTTTPRRRRPRAAR